MHAQIPIISSDEKQVNFIHEQCLKEQQKGHFSKSFGTDLLPGMYAMPIYAVPKPHSTDLCLVTDHSAGFFLLNKMIDHSSVTGFPLDNMLHLGEMLFDIGCTDGNVPLNLGNLTLPILTAFYLCIPFGRSNRSLLLMAKDMLTKT